MTVKIDGTNTVANPAFTGADTDTGLQCGTNELKLVTGGTARATVASSGKVGIGTDSPGQNLTIKRTGGQTQVSLISDTDQSGAIYFGDTASTARGVIEYDHSNDFMRLYTSGTERMRILSDGTIRLGSGCPGIDFSQIQTNASGMSSETLDSYEEGTWTPTTAGDSTGAIANASGFYTKMGNTVVCSFSFSLTNNFTNGEIGGLPFTPKDIGPNFNGAFLNTSADRAFIVQNHNSRLVSYKISNGTFPAITNGTRCTFTYLTA